MFRNAFTQGKPLKSVATAGLAALTLGAVMTTSSDSAQAYWRGYGPGGYYRHGGFGYRPFGYRFGYRPYGYRFGYRPFHPYRYGYGFRPYRFGYGY